MTDTSPNPYQPPQTETRTVQRGILFRWRIVPTLLSGFVGALAIVPSINLIAQAIWWFASDPVDTARGDAVRMLLFALGMALSGGLLMWSAPFWWRARWGVAVLLTVTAVAVCLGIFLLTTTR